MKLSNKTRGMRADREDLERAEAHLTKVQTPGPFYAQENKVFIGHVAIAVCTDAAYAARVADALNYRKRSI